MVFEMLEFYRSIRSLNRIVQTTKYMQLIFVMMKESFICQSNKQTLIFQSKVLHIFLGFWICWRPSFKPSEKSLNCLAWAPGRGLSCVYHKVTALRPRSGLVGLLAGHPVDGKVYDQHPLAFHFQTGRLQYQGVACNQMSTLLWQEL